MTVTKYIDLLASDSVNVSPHHHLLLGQRGCGCDVRTHHRGHDLERAVDDSFFFVYAIAHGCQWRTDPEWKRCQQRI